MPQAKQPTGREPSPTNQQSSGLKYYGALTTTATVSSTHHQSLPLSPLDSLNHQRADNRSKKNYNPAACGPKTSYRKIDKMKRQRAIYQMKEQEKTPEKQLNKVEIGNLPVKEFRIMIVKMIQDLGKRMEANIEKMQEILTKI